MRLNTKDMAVVAVMAALICVAGPFTIAVGPIPLSLCTFAIYLSGAVLGAKRSTLAVALYLLIGFVGVPVFSGFSGGFAKLAGVTGGYLVGYLPCAWLAGAGAQNAEAGGRFPWRLAAMLSLGTAALYAVGTAWFMIQTGNPLPAALGMCVMPFLPGDAIKIITASLLAGPIRRAIRQV